MKTDELKKMFEGDETALNIIEQQIGDVEGDAVWYPWDPHGPVTPEALDREAREAERIAGGSHVFYDWESARVDASAPMTPNLENKALVRSITVDRKPYAEVTNPKINKNARFITVQNSYSIKDELKARGYRYQDRAWYKEIAGPEDAREEIRYLKSRGVPVKFENMRGFSPEVRERISSEYGM